MLCTVQASLCLRIFLLLVTLIDPKKGSCARTSHSDDCLPMILVIPSPTDLSKIRQANLMGKMRTAQTTKPSLSEAPLANHHWALYFPNMDGAKLSVYRNLIAACFD